MKSILTTKGKTIRRLLVPATHIDCVQNADYGIGNKRERQVDVGGGTCGNMIGMVDCELGFDGTDMPIQ